MAVINSLLEQQQQQEIESQPNTFIQQIIELLREINQLLNNPVVLQRVSQNSPQQPIQTTLPQVQEQQFNEEKFIQFLQTPKGREMLIRGLEKVKEMVGDLRISEIIAILKGDTNAKLNK